MTVAQSSTATFATMASLSVSTTDDGIATIMIDRAPVNALPPRDWVELRQIVEKVGSDLSVRSVVISGGTGRFCAGADIRTLTEPNDEPALMLRIVAEVASAIRACRVPVIAAIDGPAHGGGLELALACDVRVASSNATFAASGINMGLVASVRSLVHAVGDARARSMLLTGDRVDATTGQSWGLFTHLDEAPTTAATELASAISKKAPLAAEATKRALREVVDLDASAHDALMIDLFSELARSSDHSEAIAAFLEKRDPAFLRE